MTERTYTQDLDGVYYALQDLAHVSEDGSVNAIAEHLHSLGIRGERKSAYCCPIANWLRRNFGDDCDPEVDDATVRVRKFGNHKGDFIDVPDEVSDFISHFDGGSYSDLIEEASNA